VSFNSTISGNSSFNVNFLLALEEKEILAAGNITFQIAKGTTKWSFNYQDWPFANMNNTLRLVLRYVVIS
jgi:hypothetical protein